MCIKCDQMVQDPGQFSESEIIDHHVDLITEIVGLAREISQNQQRIAMLSDRLNEIDAELELRETKKDGLN